MVPAKKLAGDCTANARRGTFAEKRVVWMETPNRYAVSRDRGHANSRNPPPIFLDMTLSAALDSRRREPGAAAVVSNRRPTCDVLQLPDQCDLSRHHYS